MVSSRLRGVRRNVELLNLYEINVTIGMAKLDRRVAGNFEVAANCYCS
jgi:hypothetical protein